jgi:hypothetical protein
MFDQVKTFTADSGQALRGRLEAYAKLLKDWLGRPWGAARTGRAAGLVVAAAALLSVAGRLARLGAEKWRAWRRPGEFDPVRREAGRWLARVREEPEGREVVSDLRRLRYGRKETWPEPRGVFKRAKRVRRVNRR